MDGFWKFQGATCDIPGSKLEQETRWGTIGAAHFFFRENVVPRVRQMKPHGAWKKKGQHGVGVQPKHTKTNISTHIPTCASALKSMSFQKRASSSSMSHQALRAVKHCENVPSAHGILFPKCFKWKPGVHLTHLLVGVLFHKYISHTAPNGCRKLQMWWKRMRVCCRSA